MRKKHRATLRRHAREDGGGLVLAVGLIGIFLMVIGLSACTSPAEKTREIHDELVYFKDHRTDVCFAFWMSSDDSRTSVMASVPCEKVAHMLTNGPERGR